VAVSNNIWGIPKSRRRAWLSREQPGLPRITSAWGGRHRRRRDAALLRSLCKVSMKTAILALTLAITFQLRSAIAQVTPATDPTAGFGRLFGLGGHTCKQYDDTGKLFIYSEGLPSLDIVSWMQRSANGTKTGVPMPEELASALPNIPGCLPGKHHAATSNEPDESRRMVRNRDGTETSE
jgi:hypothetical protein